MFKQLQNKGLWRGVGIFLVGTLVVASWWTGWFQFIFYILGLYGAVYLVSYLFRTTAIISAMLFIGGGILYIASALVGLYLLFNVLSIMFTESFFYGLLLIILLGTFGSLLYFIPMAIGMVLGYPLMFMSEDIEKRFHKSEYKVIDPKEDADTYDEQ